MPAGPYPDDRAAVHHLFAGGWMYVLRFDHGVASAGFLLRNDRPAAAAAGPAARAATWRLLLDRYPVDRARSSRTRSRCCPPVAAPRVQHRLARAAGDGWALLPHAFAFLDPLFSTGIAWSLLGVERLARLCEEGGGSPLGRRPPPLRAPPGGGGRAHRPAHPRRLPRGRRLRALRAGRAALLRRRQLGRAAPAPPARGGDRPPGGLGGLPRRRTTRALAALVARHRCAAPPGPPTSPPGSCRALAPYDLVGLDDPARRNLHPVDLAPLRERAGRLGLTPAELGSRLHRTARFVRFP